MNRIILASASPRRSELLSSAGVQFDIEISEVDETLLSGESPSEYAERVAIEKALYAASKTDGRFVVAADTIVVLDGKIFGKPADEDDAARMLKSLSGRTHQVISSFVIIDRNTGSRVAEKVTTDVHFAEITDDEITRYVATGCPLDKAGGYAIQGGAAYMVEWINGSYTNVVGLPLAEVIHSLKALGAIA